MIMRFATYCREPHVDDDPSLKLQQEIISFFDEHLVFPLTSFNDSKMVPVCLRRPALCLRWAITGFVSRVINRPTIYALNSRATHAYSLLKEILKNYVHPS